MSGRGTLYSYTRVWAGPEIFENDLPYTLCVVDLEEGIRAGSRLVGDFAGAKVGEAVSIVFVHYTNGTLFYFEIDE